MSTPMLLLSLANPAVAQDAIIGQPCRPGDEPPREGLVCAEVWSDGAPELTRVEGLVLNAVKGDLLLSGGCKGPIGGLFLNLDPKQRYSHEGIITNNLGSRLVHTTTSQDRYNSDVALAVDDPLVPNQTEGIRPDMLKFGWPGGIEEETRLAYEGNVRVDPDGASFEFHSFESEPFECPGYAASVPQLVVTFP
ncbi:MAG: hypothetical protein AAF602_00175, partial [Myxococcota bacterium]